LTARSGESGKLVNVGFELVASPGVGLEVGSITEITGAAGISVPEFPDFFL
jgi:hypothetical protein